MLKNSEKQYQPCKKLDDTAAIIADIHGCSARYVRMVRDGDRESPEIFEDYLDFEETVRDKVKELKEKRALLREVNKLVPFK